MVANPNGLTATVRGRANARVPNSYDYVMGLLEEAYLDKFGCESTGADADTLDTIAMQWIVNRVVIVDEESLELHRGSEDLGFRFIDG